ncbi:MAG: hypothetical protein J7M40_08235 [Planctomycetes bacterium]|nr:hypothetical protein [Planctomycetota bacterium]
MKSDQILTAWKEQRSAVAIGADLSDKVMNRIYRYEQEKAAGLFDVQGFIEHLTNRPFAKAALAAAGVFGGFVRVGVTFYVLLF